MTQEEQEEFDRLQNEEHTGIDVKEHQTIGEALNEIEEVIPVFSLADAKEEMEYCDTCPSIKDCAILYHVNRLSFKVLGRISTKNMYCPAHPAHIERNKISEPIADEQQL